LTLIIEALAGHGKLGRSQALETAMELQLRWDEGMLLLNCAGEIGWDGVDVLVRRTGEALDGHEQPQVLIDLEAVDFITSAGIGALLQLRKLIADRGGRGVLVGAAPMISQLFATVGLNRHVPVAETMAQARRLLADECIEAGTA
jgi:anti-anti-sigma factor